MELSVPTRFVDPSQPRRLSSWQRWYYGGDPTPSREQGRRLAELLSHGDPLADALVEHWLAGAGVADGRRQLDLALSQGLDAVDEPPEPLRRGRAASRASTPRTEPG
jgi:hypothetical protein